MSKPLAAGLASYTAGITAAVYFNISDKVVFIISGALIIIATYYCLRVRKKYLPSFFLAILALGMLWTQYQTALNRGNIDFLANKNTLIEGVVAEEPDVRLNSSNYVIEVINIRQVQGDELTNNLPDRPEGKIMLSITRPEMKYCYGDILLISGIPQLPDIPGNPGEFNYREYLRNKGIQLLVRSWQGTGVEKTGEGNHNPIIDLCLKIKVRLFSVIEASSTKEDAALIKGILFGSIGIIDPNIMRDFALAGIIHILSVSGCHISILAVFIMFAGEKLNLSIRKRSILTAIITLFYAVMTGAGPPVLRALVMVWVFLLAQGLKRNYDWGSSLSLAALIILLYNPYDLFNAGFQLSFAATWGLFYLTPVLRLMLDKLPYIGSAIAITMAAQIAVLPITSYYFSYFSLVSVPANMIVVPLVSVVMFLGALSVMLGLLWLPLAEAVNLGTGFVLRIIKETAGFLGNLPYAVINIRPPGLIETVVFYGTLILLVEIVINPEVKLRAKRLWILYRVKFVTVLLLISAVLMWAFILVNDKQYMEVTFLDIGQGDCVLIQTPLGKNVVIDTGGVQITGRSGYDPGERVLVPFLRKKGISQIDLLLLSHIHNDHVGGAGALLKSFPVKVLAVTPQFQETPEGAEILNNFGVKGVQIKNITEGERITLDERIILEALHPPVASATGENNDSMVLRLGYGEQHILFTGDAEEPVLDTLAGYSAEIHAEIVKVPHHGSRNAWHERFYRTVNPQMAVISVGRNSFGHPSPEVLTGLAGLGIQVLRTDRSGAVIIKSDGRDWILK
jgi:competence protein ComEC